MKSPSAASGAKFVRWLQDQVVRDARGDGVEELRFAPAGRLWLGRLAPEDAVKASNLGERAERLEPCATGFRVLVKGPPPEQVDCLVRARVWHQETPKEEHGAPAVWKKSSLVEARINAKVPKVDSGSFRAGEAELSAALANAGASSLAAAVDVQLESGPSGLELTVTVVNTSRWAPSRRATRAAPTRRDNEKDVVIDPSQRVVEPPGEDPSRDANLYEVYLEAEVGETAPFLLDNLPGGFRYDREVSAYGVNGGVAGLGPRRFASSDSVAHEQMRPEFWDEQDAGLRPDLTFDKLATAPLPELHALVAAMRRWGVAVWSEKELARRAAEGNWNADAQVEARAASAEWDEEVRRVEEGIRSLETDDQLLRSFALANRAFRDTGALRYKRWRPFQVGFLLTQLPSLVEPPDATERGTVDILRFPTGGGKTETYLGLLVLSAFYDRLRGKLEGVTGWARFPLRMLSLQQTQRFADILASAEITRRDEAIAGLPFSLGFLVGEPGTPNAIRSTPRGGRRSLGDLDPGDVSWPPRFQVLVRCPFCGGRSLSMKFDKPTWRLEHMCLSPDCRWRGPLPFYIVDQEIFRFLPTVVVGTLDKAAVIATQAAMRGMYGPPLGVCKAGHGFTYAKRSGTRSGCLFPDCPQPKAGKVGQDERLFAPTIRIQDELHLLRDSLGAIDAHYEALLDHLQSQSGGPAKILASSATISGYANQAEVLYRRPARVFPEPGPKASHSFWAQDSSELSRLYVGLAPRGLTLDYASDRANECLQRAARKALADPKTISREAGVAEDEIPDLVGYYGVNVVYGSTLKDVEAASRSFETQFDIPVNSVTLTGRTGLDEVRDALERLVTPEPEFERRIHMVAASSMLSHGVDIDRLNVMVMLGLPLATAEFIQTTSRVGRSVPGLVFVMHKIGRERDAKVFRTFAQFVQHADRLVDPVPITRRSRRVLELTFPGLELGRVYGVHEPRAIAANLSQLTTSGNVRTAFARLPIVENDERDALIVMLNANGVLDEGIRDDIETYMRVFFRNVNDHPASDFTSDLMPHEPMKSLRDVEEQVPIFSSNRGSS